MAGMAVIPRESGKQKSADEPRFFVVAGQDTRASMGSTISSTGQLSLRVRGVITWFLSLLLAWWRPVRVAPAARRFVTASGENRVASPPIFA